MDGVKKIIWHVTCDMWHMMGGKHYLNISALTVWDRQRLEDSEQLNEWITKVFIEQPRSHWVCYLWLEWKEGASTDKLEVVFFKWWTGQFSRCALTQEHYANNTVDTPGGFLYLLSILFNNILFYHLPG